MLNITLSTYHLNKPVDEIYTNLIYIPKFVSDLSNIESFEKLLKSQ